MKKLLFAISIISLSLFIFSCSDDTPKNVVGEWSSSEKADVFKDVQAPVQVFNVNSSQEIFIITDREALFTFPANGFETKRGQEVSGTITLEITEMYTKGEIILYGIHTMSGGQILESGGEFRVQAFKDGEPLQMKDGVYYNVKKPDQDPQSGMELFFGSEDETDWVLADPDFNGVPISEWLIDSTSIGIGYECFPNGLEYVNIDYFTKFETEDTRVEVELPPAFSNTNSVVIAVFEDYNIVINLESDSVDKVFFNNAFPIGEKVEFVAIANIDDEYYLDSGKDVVEVGLRVTLDPQKLSYEDLKEFLLGLDD